MIFSSARKAESYFSIAAENAKFGDDGCVHKRANAT
jgi:hypothetical protein